MIIKLLFGSWSSWIRIIFRTNIRLRDETLTGITTPAQNEPETNANEKEVDTPQISKTWTSRSYTDFYSYVMPVSSYDENITLVYEFFPLKYMSL